MKYRVTEKMAQRTAQYGAGDTIEPTPENAILLLAKGYIEPLDMVDAKEDKQLRQYRRKEK